MMHGILKQYCAARTDEGSRLRTGAYHLQDGRTLPPPQDCLVTRMEQGKVAHQKERLVEKTRHLNRVKSLRRANLKASEVAIRFEYQRWRFVSSIDFEVL
jgi:hypothetical protein